MAELQELCLENNFFRKIPQMLFAVVTLIKLDFSNNHIPTIPEAIGLLVNLEEFRFNDNSIIDVPTNIQRLKKLKILELGTNRIAKFQVEICRLTNLHRLILCENLIKSIPDEIINLTELTTLDMTGNQIEALPVTFYKMQSLKLLHAYDKFQKHGLWLHRNLLKTPPHDIWKSNDIEQIYTYLRKLQIRRTESLQRQKMVVLGSQDSGKTSLIRTLVNQKSCLTATMMGSDLNLNKEIMSTTSVVEITTWNTENNVKFMVHDLGGQDAYSCLHHLFCLESRAFFIIVYDHYRYTLENHYYHIGRWLDLLQVYAPNAVVKIIGTHVDRCRRGQAQATLDLVQERIKSYEEERIQRINQQLDILQQVINGKAPSSILFKSPSYVPLQQLESPKEKDENVSFSEVNQNDLMKQKLTLEKLKEETSSLRLQNISVVGSAEEIRGILKLTNDLEVLAVNKDLFPHAQREIPDSWQEVRKYVKLLPGHYIKRKDIQILIRQHRVKENEKGSAEEDRKTTNEIIEFLCLTGEIMCLDHIEDLKDVVFHRPRHIHDLLRGLYRHDLQSYLNFQTNRVFKSRSKFTQETFNEARERILINGQICRPLIICLWFYMKLTYKEFNEAVDLIPKMDLCYLIPQPEVPGPRSDYVPMMIIPQYVLDPEPDDISDLWPKEIPVNMIQLEVVIFFQIYPPLDLYDQVSCRLHNHLDKRIDWCDTIFGQVDTVQMLLQRRSEPSERTEDIASFTRSPSPQTRCNSATSKEGPLSTEDDVKETEPTEVAVAPMTTENIQKLEAEHERQSGVFTNRSIIRPLTSESDRKSEVDKRNKSRRASIETTSDRSESRRRFRRTTSGKRVSIADSTTTWNSSRQPVRPGRQGATTYTFKIRGSSLEMMHPTLLFYDSNIKDLLKCRKNLSHYIMYNATNCSQLAKDQCFPSELFQTDTSSEH